MATLLIATPLVHSNAFRRRAMVPEFGGFQGQKRLRVSCRQLSAPATGEGHRDDSIEIVGRRDEISVLQSLSSPLLNLSPADLIAAFLEEEDINAKALLAEVPGVFQQPDPVSKKPVSRPVGRCRSGKVVFTEEKARRLRKENRATQTFHDKWFHSAIASKLASPE